MPGTVSPLPVMTASVIEFPQRGKGKIEELTRPHILDRLASVVGLLRLPAAHVHAVAEDVAHSAGSFLEAAYDASQ